MLCLMHRATASFAAASGLHLNLLVFSFSEAILKRALSVGHKQLVSVGVCFGKFTKTGKFRLHVTALDILAQYALVGRDRIGVFNVVLGRRGSGACQCVQVLTTVSWLGLACSSKSGLSPMVKCHFFTETTY